MQNASCQLAFSARKIFNWFIEFRLNLFIKEFVHELTESFKKKMYKNQRKISFNQKFRKFYKKEYLKSK